MKVYKRDTEDWWMDYTVGGKRKRENSHTRDKREAEKLMRERAMDAFQILRQTFSSGPKAHTGMKLDRAAELTIREYWMGMSSEVEVGYLLDKILKILGASTDLTKITEETYIQLKRGLQATGVSDATINHHFSALNVILKHCKREHGVDCLPGVKAHLPKTPGRIRVISKAEEEAIYEWFGSVSKLLGGWTRQDLLEITRVLFHTGMRRGEIFGFTVNMVNEDTIIFQPHQHKTGRVIGAKAVCLTKTAQAIITDRISRYEMKIGDRVFPYSGVAYTRLFNHMKNDFGLAKDKDFVPHAIRHTFASRLAEKGLDIVQVSKLLGHSNIQTTMKYVHFFNSKLVSAVACLDEEVGSGLTQSVTQES